MPIDETNTRVWHMNKDTESRYYI